MKLLTAATPNQRKADRGPAHQRLRGDHDRRAAAGAARHVLHHRLCGRAGHHGLRPLVEVLARPCQVSTCALDTHAHARTHARMNERAQARTATAAFLSFLSLRPPFFLPLSSFFCALAASSSVSCSPLLEAWLCPCRALQLDCGRRHAIPTSHFQALPVRRLEPLRRARRRPLPRGPRPRRHAHQRSPVGGCTHAGRKVLKAASCDISRFCPRFDWILKATSHRIQDLGSYNKP